MRQVGFRTAPCLQGLPLQTAEQVGVPMRQPEAAYKTYTEAIKRGWDIATRVMLSPRWPRCQAARDSQDVDAMLAGLPNALPRGSWKFTGTR